LYFPFLLSLVAFFIPHSIVSLCLCYCIFHTFIYQGTRYRSWLRRYATKRKVAGSIPDEVIIFFNWPNSCSRTIALGSTQSLIKMSTSNLRGGIGRPPRIADLTAICESDCLDNVEASTSHNPMGLYSLLQR
jgi:hypothetical protein